MRYHTPKLENDFAEVERTIRNGQFRNIVNIGQKTRMKTNKQKTQNTENLKDEQQGPQQNIRGVLIRSELQ